jgi:P27 family predicted phage terminase small subunit
VKGRKPTPSNLLTLTKGKLYGDQRDRAELEPKPEKELLPRCPSRFSKAERREWRFYKNILQNYSLFTLACAPILSMLCTAEAHYKDCAKTVSDTGIIIKGFDGSPRKNPYWLVMNDLQKMILKYHQELGLSNTGLARMGSLAMKAKKQEDDWGDLLD